MKSSLTTLSISYFPQGGYTKVTDILPLSIQKELKIEGFLVGRWKARWVEGIMAMAKWVGSGQIKVRMEHSHWSRSVQILCSDWLNLTMLVPRSMP